MNAIDIVHPALNDYLLAHASPPADAVLRDLAEEIVRRARRR